MTRAAQVTRTVSAMRKARSTPGSLPERAAMAFAIYEDNGGGYHWALVADGGEILVRSASFGSYEEAKRVGRIVHRGASSAAFEDRTDPRRQSISPPAAMIARTPSAGRMSLAASAARP